MFGWVRTLHASDGAKNVQFFICLPVSFFLSVTLSNAAQLVKALQPQRYWVHLHHFYEGCTQCFLENLTPALPNLVINKLL